MSPKWGTVADEAEYTGRTAVLNTADVKARVTGFLKAVQFEGKEGTRVSAGQPLFLIDDEPYLAQLKQAQAQVALYEAQYNLAEKTFALKNELLQADKKAGKIGLNIQPLEVQQAEASMKEAKAAWNAAKASQKIYELNEQYTKVTAPIDGFVGRINVTKGNVILQDQTLLTTVVNLDNIYVYFDLDAPTWTKFPRDGLNGWPISLTLPRDPASSPDSQTPTIQGKIDFVNPQFNPATDTVLVRARFENSLKTDRVPLLRPGMFVRVKFALGQPYKALLVPDRAIQSELGKKYVYVADAEDRVKKISVDIGRPQEQGLRAIKGGQLTEKHRVILTHLLEIKEKQRVQPVQRKEATADPALQSNPPPTDKNGKGVKGK
jgi:RND family efflux transporter MFP subunit